MKGGEILSDGLAKKNWRRIKSEKNKEKILRGGDVVPDDGLNQNDSGMPGAGKVTLDMSETERKNLKERILLLERYQESTGIPAHQDTIFYQGEQTA